MNEFMTNGKWISSMSFNADRRELIVVDFRSAYAVDVTSGLGSGPQLSSSSSTTSSGCRLLRKIVGSKSSSSDSKLIDPFAVSVATVSGDSRLVFTDRSDQSVKVSQLSSK